MQMQKFKKIKSRLFSGIGKAFSNDQKSLQLDDFTADLPTD